MTRLEEGDGKAVPSETRLASEAAWAKLHEGDFFVPSGPVDDKNESVWCWLTGRGEIPLCPLRGRVEHYHCEDCDRVTATVLGLRRHVAVTRHSAWQADE